MRNTGKGKWRRRKINLTSARLGGHGRILALRRLRQEDYHKTSLGYTVRSYSKLPKEKMKLTSAQGRD